VFRDAPLIVVSIDTLRSDHLPVYGYGAVATPAIDALAREAVLFERAYTPYPLTLPAHASLFTGFLPPRHGVRNNIGFRLPEEALTLAERLAGAGYRTAGAVSSMVLREGAGIAQGFEAWDDDMSGGLGASALRLFAERPANLTLDAALAQLDALPRGQPFFLFVHLFDPHTPYEPPEPHRSRWESAYDGEIAFADEQFGRLLDALRSRGLYDPALVVLLGDHGEGLGDHVEREHGFLLYRETLQVPLLIKLPGGRRSGDRIAEPVGLVDVAPTVLALLGEDADGLDGTPLFPRPDPARGVYSETWFGSYQWAWSPMRSMISDGRHYIEAPTPELYDLVRDPAEQDNLLLEGREAPDLVAALNAVGQGAHATEGISEAERRQLESLGYLGGTVDPPPDGPDPKDRIGLVVELWEQLERVGRSASDEPERRAVELIERLELRNETLAVTLANNFLEAGRPATAERLLEPFAAGDSLEVLRLLGEAAAAQGKSGVALSRFEALLARAPDHAPGHLGRALTLMGEGRFAAARPSLDRALELDPALTEGWNALGAIHLQSGDPKSAAAAFERAVGLDPTFDDAWSNLELVYRRVGDAAGAARVRERRAEISRRAP
jgi:arylsulfatase A-like enzyme/Flp pilus assembly protein TadD